MARNYNDITGKNNHNYKTGLCVKGLKKPGYYNSWMNMKARCLRETNPKYYRYGGRGIKIHEPWMDIRVFSLWAIESGWREGMSIDRIDNDGDYTPENCRWISHAENSRKKSTTKISFKDAETIRVRVKNGECAYDLAKEYGVVHGTVWFIVKNFTHVEEMACTERLKSRDAKNSAR
jgi:hypothetical protein